MPTKKKKKKRAAKAKPAKKKWCLYVLLCKDGTIYCGITNDLERRIAQHNAGKGARYTRGRGPLTLLRSWPQKSQSAALKAEFSFKKLSRSAKDAYLAARGHFWQQKSDICEGFLRQNDIYVVQEKMVTTKAVTKKAPFSRRVVDHVTDELVNVLSSGETFEFKALFAKVFEGLKLKNAVSGGEEMLRLRSYEKILKLTNCGLVKKVGKTYRALEGIESASSAHRLARLDSAILAAAQAKA